MRRKFFLIILVTAAWAFLATATMAARAAQPPKPFPIVPAIVISQTAFGMTGQCGEDIVLLQFSQGTFYQLNVKIVRFSNDPRPRAVKFYLSGPDYRVFETATRQMAPGEDMASTIEDPSGFWHTYVSSIEYLSGGPATLGLTNLLVIIRQKSRDCLLFKEVPAVGGKGGEKG